MAAETADTPSDKDKKDYQAPNGTTQKLTWTSDSGHAA